MGQGKGETQRTDSNERPDRSTAAAPTLEMGWDHAARRRSERALRAKAHSAVVRRAEKRRPVAGGIPAALADARVARRVLCQLPLLTRVVEHPRWSINRVLQRGPVVDLKRPEGRSGTGGESENFDL